MLVKEPKLDKFFTPYHPVPLTVTSKNHSMLTAEGGGHWGILETAKPKEKIIQNRKTAKKFGQNRKPHTKPSKTDTMSYNGDKWGIQSKLN